MAVEFSDVIVFSAGGILGFLCKTLIGHRLAIERSFAAIATNEFNRGAAAFRAVYCGMISSLRRNAGIGDIGLHEFLASSWMDRQHEAKILFEPYLDAAALSQFDQAWQDYLDWTQTYPRSDANHGEARRAHNKVLSCQYLDHIDTLLAFAKPRTAT